MAHPRYFLYWFSFRNIEFNVYLLQLKIVSHNHNIVGAKAVLHSPVSVLVRNIDNLKDPKRKRFYSVVFSTPWAL